MHFHTTYTANSGLSCLLWYSSRVRWFHIWNTTGTVQLERQCDFTRVSLACHLRVARVSHRERDAIRTRVGSTRKGIGAFMPTPYMPTPHMPTSEISVQLCLRLRQVLQRS